ncbi:MAG: glucose-6-phosphate isomerase [Gammaproteobacteria bacterium]|nr:glucose-6-phosphate isomerase [Gammaproteobacteria bacterium]
MTSLSASPAWQALLAHSTRFSQRDSRCCDLLNDNKRFSEYSLQHEQLLLDYSKNFCTAETMQLLFCLAQQTQVSAAIEAMFTGKKINITENRAALHTALRIPPTNNPYPEVVTTIQRMADLVHAVHSGEWQGCTGERISDVVNIGIGGSDLGPAMVSEALASYSCSEVKLHFVSNVDPVQLTATLAKLDPARTLFIIASKSFRTLETRENANSARKWFLLAGHGKDDIARHFIAITTNLKAAEEFGINSQNLFPLWDWVGGRFSLWSAIGLSIALAIGMENFRDLLAGAYSMDRHFQSSPLEQNIPVVMALLSIWYTGFFNAHSSAVVPYAQPLRQLPRFLQQLCMESLGKRTAKDGSVIDTNSGEVIWGTEGTNGQHSYFQLLHQGTEFIPVDFIAVAKSAVADELPQHRQLLANCLSQSLALLQGRLHPTDEARSFPGNRPSNTLLLADLTPYNLGSLIALYEHKVYVQSVIWGINAFDQFGVELGKDLSESLYTAFADQAQRESLDPSTKGLMELMLKWGE